MRIETEKEEMGQQKGESSWDMESEVTGTTEGDARGRQQVNLMFNTTELSNSVTNVSK